MMRLNILLASVTLASCSHPGRIEEGSKSDASSVVVHIHDSQLQAGAPLLVFEKICSRRPYPYGPLYRDRLICQREPAGRASVMGTAGPDLFLVRIPSALRGQTNLEFEQLPSE